MITLQVNGKQIELEQALPLLAYLEKLGVNPRTIAVEHNGTIIERATYAELTLREGDTVEIVRMVGGGCGFMSSAGWIGPMHTSSPLQSTRNVMQS